MYSTFPMQRPGLVSLSLCSSKHKSHKVSHLAGDLDLLGLDNSRRDLLMRIRRLCRSWLVLPCINKTLPSINTLSVITKKL